MAEQSADRFSYGGIENVLERTACRMQSDFIEFENIRKEAFGQAVPSNQELGAGAALRSKFDAAIIEFDEITIDVLIYVSLGRR
jgi:hypothetical protein